MAVNPAEVVRSYFDRLLVRRDLSVCDELLADRYVDHDAPAGTPPGPDATRRYVSDLLEAYPDLQFAIQDVAAQDRSVALRATWRGTHRDTGTSVYQTGLVLVEVDEAGRLSERWSAYHWYADSYGQAHKADNPH